MLFDLVCGISCVYRQTDGHGETSIPPTTSSRC